MTDLVERVAKAIDYAPRIRLMDGDNEGYYVVDRKGRARAAIDVVMKDYREQDMKAITECTDAEFQAKLDHLRMIRCAGRRK